MNQVLEKANRLKAEAELWASKLSGETVRLVQYSGMDCLSPIDISPKEVGDQVHGLICEGFHVIWHNNDQKAILIVWEYPGPEPSLDKALTEESLIDFSWRDEAI